jgi:hypothetical protein
MTRKQIFVRGSLTIGLPFILLYAFIAELFRGIRKAFLYAWIEVRINVDAYRREMTREDY